MSPFLSACLLAAALASMAPGGTTAELATASTTTVSTTASTTISAAPPRGTLLDGPTQMPIILPGGGGIESMEPATLRLVLKHAQGGVLMAIAGEPHCSISVHALRYQTVGGHGEPTDAGGVVMLPGGEDAACAGPRPVLLYAHGTSLDRGFSMARLNGEARLVAAMFVAQGYIVVAPDYAGYGASSLPYHPYLNAEQQGADMIDALRAARAGLRRIGVRTSAQLFLAGYSQGGFVALATQRAMERDFPDEFHVTATAGLSGPYAMLLMSDTIFGGQPNTGITAFLPLLTTAGQKSGGMLYGSPADVYEARYAAGIESLLPGTQRVDDLIKTGRLPAGALFARDSLPQPQGEGAASYFADLNLVRTSYRNAYLADMAAHPCGADPARPLDCQSELGLRRWMQKNDLRDYLPRSPLLLCGGQRDPVVPFVNASATAAYFAARGAPPLLLDMDAAPARPAYAGIQRQFAQTLQTAAANAEREGRDPRKAVLDNYHGRTVGQYCFMAAREFFGRSGQ